MQMRERQKVRRHRWHSDKHPSGIAPKTPLQQFYPEYTGHPATFIFESSPRMPKVSKFWIEHVFISSFSRSGRTVRVHLDFLPVSLLLLFAVTLENSAQQFSPCSHLDGGVTSPPTWSCNSYGLFSPGS